MRAGVLRLQCGSLLQMFQRRLRLILLQKQNSQIQLREKVVRGELKGFPVGSHGFIRLVKTTIGKTQVEPGRHQTRAESQ